MKHLSFYIGQHKAKPVLNSTWITNPYQVSTESGETVYEWADFVKNRGERATNTHTPLGYSTFSIDATTGGINVLVNFNNGFGHVIINKEGAERNTYLRHRHFDFTVIFNKATIKDQDTLELILNKIERLLKAGASVGLAGDYSLKDFLALEVSYSD